SDPDRSGSVAEIAIALKVERRFLHDEIGPVGAETLVQSSNQVGIGDLAPVVAILQHHHARADRARCISSHAEGKARSDCEVEREDLHQAASASSWSACSSCVAS